jgi:hypothetical protein
MNCIVTGAGLAAKISFRAPLVYPLLERHFVRKQ